MRRWLDDLLAAFQFLTRLPVRPFHYEPDSMVRSAKFYPIVGLGLGLAAAMVQRLLAVHLNRSVVVVLMLGFLVWVTAGLHEDGLADTADGLGGGWGREQSLTIMRDSRIGSFGATAIALSLLARFVLLSSLPAGRFLAYIVSAQVLSRWTILPLSYFLKPARSQEGQGARVAGKLSVASLLVGTVLAVAAVALFLRASFWVPLATTSAVALLSALYYQRKLGGVTGDCLGATVQLSEIAVYLYGVWNQ